MTGKEGGRADLLLVEPFFPFLLAFWREVFALPVGDDYTCDPRSGRTRLVRAAYAEA